MTDDNIRRDDSLDSDPAPLPPDPDVAAKRQTPVAREEVVDRRDDIVDAGPRPLDEVGSPNLMAWLVGILLIVALVVFLLVMNDKNDGAENAVPKQDNAEQRSNDDHGHTDAPPPDDQDIPEDTPEEVPAPEAPVAPQ